MIECTTKEFTVSLHRAHFRCNDAILYYSANSCGIRLAVRCLLAPQTLPHLLASQALSLPGSGRHTHAGRSDLVACLTPLAVARDLLCVCMVLGVGSECLYHHLQDWKFSVLVFVYFLIFFITQMTGLHLCSTELCADVYALYRG